MSENRDIGRGLTKGKGNFKGYLDSEKAKKGNASNSIDDAGGSNKMTVKPSGESRDDKKDGIEENLDYVSAERNAPPSIPKEAGGDVLSESELSKFLFIHQSSRIS